MDLLLYVLAAFAIAWSLANEDGPAGLFAKARYILEPKLGDGVNCPICVGFWVALVLFPVYYFWPIALTPFAVHGVIIFATVYLARK